MHGKRKHRLAGLVRECLGEIIQREYSGYLPAMVTIMNVELSDDLMYAKVFVSYFGDEDAKKRSFSILRKELRNIRKRLGTFLTTKHIPKLILIEDSSLDYAFKIENILNKINEDRDTKKGLPGGDREG